MDQRPLDGERVRVVYILGSGHSGSTLLDVILGSHPDVANVGELKEFVAHEESGFQLDGGGTQCCCGESLKDCGFWSSVSHELTQRTGPGTISLDSWNGPARDSHLALARSILAASGSSVLCDSSKDRRRAYQLLRTDAFDVFIVHLVRDARAVAYSNLKKGRNPLPWASAWQRTNLVDALGFGWRRDRYMRIRYEDFVTNPALHVEQIMEAVGLDFRPQEQLEYWKHAHHNVGSNHIVFSGDPGIRGDHTYLERLSDKDWRGCTWRSVVGLKAFGYPLSRSSTAEELWGLASGKRP